MEPDERLMHDDAAAALFGSVVQPERAAPKAFPLVSIYLESADFRRGFRLCPQAEHLECVGILPFRDEFCKEMGFATIHEKFGQALA